MSFRKTRKPGLAWQPTELRRGETCWQHVARKSTLENWFFKDVVSGSQDVMRNFYKVKISVTKSYRPSLNKSVASVHSLFMQAVIADKK